MPPIRRLVLWSLLAGSLVILANTPASAEQLPFGQRVLQIAEAEAAELARLDSALAAATDTETILALQRRATYVKLACRMALHEAQLASAEGEELRARLEALTGDLRDRLQRLEPEVPQEDRFDPLAAMAALAEEVQTCDE